ncbi:hypothetical protein [Methanococcoides sp. FTZ1]|uniref:hypothetical protein n=1 Tax=Methanococcoides sp. FTZ1 TaxID=3439061 RepID=UPI003F839302
MDINTLETDPLILDWFDSSDYAKNTRRNRLFGMQRYTEYTGMTPTELLEEAEQEIKQGKLMRERKIKARLLGFKRELNDSGLAPKSINDLFGSAKAFYKAYDIDLPKISRKGKKVQALEENKQIPDKDTIREILDYASIRNKAIVLTQISSGLAANEVMNLKVSSF